MAIAGLRGTGDWGADERPKNFREMILWRRPTGSAPLTALMSKMPSERTDDPEFNWWEEEMNQIRLQMSAATLGTTDTTVTVLTSGVQNATDLVPGDLILVETGNVTSGFSYETMYVSSVTSASQFVAKRGYAGSTPTSIAASSFLSKIGNVFAEGTGAPNASTRNPTKLYNYTQIFKTTYEITRTAKSTRTRTGDPVKNDKKRKMFDHSIALETAFIFGRRFETASSAANGKPERGTGGILHMMNQYYSAAIKNYTTAPTVNTLLDDISPIWDYESDAGSERIAFCGNGALNALNKLAQAQSQTRINFDGYVSVYGMKLARWVFPQGEIYLRTHPLFNVHGRFTNDILIIDPSCLKYRYLLDTTFKDNIQNNDADSEKGMWISEVGLELRHARTMKYLSNVTV